MPVHIHKDLSNKEKILLILKDFALEEKNEGFISGEELALNLSISRAAVNKAIKSLRRDGFLIEAQTRKGYKFKDEPDEIDGKKIESLIEEYGTNCTVQSFKTVDSTNFEAKRQTLDKVLNRVAFVSGKQTAGHGRLGRVFYSPADSGLYFSLVYRPLGGVKNPALLTAGAAVSVCRAVKELYGEECKIKWVNDVFLNGKKICGILTEGIANFETATIDFAIVGIGINVRNSNFTGELSKIAGSIEDIMQSEGKKIPKVPRNLLCAKIIFNLLKIYDSYYNGEKIFFKNVIDEYRSRSLLKGLTVAVNPIAGGQAESYVAKVLDISEEAELIVECEDKSIKKLFSGEVSLKSSSFAK
ncbi:biotin--[acetyl-CoA-carboxylase] ligase [Treponema pectinovorum]|uniref:biotin--[acetyl-CoA-carboxylase] ligase n=1 Tax=Treponema pectinovorum TaxID=164 RepID=UPI003D8A7EA6